MGEWCDFHCFDAESDSIYLRGAEKLITELDLVLDAETNYLTIPNGSMPRFPPNAYSDHPDFAYMIYNWLEIMPMMAWKKQHMGIVMYHYH